MNWPKRFTGLPRRMNPHEIELFAAVRPVVVALEALAIPYCIGGSVASGVFGEPRQPFADRARHRAADTAVDLVEDHRRRAAFLRQRDCDGAAEARASELLGSTTAQAVAVGDVDLDGQHQAA